MRYPISKMQKLTKKGICGYEAMWNSIKDLNGEPFTVGDLEKRADPAKKPSSLRKSIKGYIKRLVLAGYLEDTMTFRAAEKLYKVIKNQKEAPRLQADGAVVTQGSGRQNMWRTMKMLGVFTATDLAIAATTDETKVSELYAKEYVCALFKAGYLKIVQPHKPRGHKASYRLIPSKKTGPLAPVIQRDKSVYDPNLRKVMWSRASDVGGAS